MKWKDVRDIAIPVLRKRMILKEDATSRGSTEEGIVQELLDKTAVPPLEAAAS